MVKVKPEWVDEWRELREKGWSYKRVAKRYGLTVKTVRYWLKEDYRQRERERARKRWEKVGRRPIHDYGYEITARGKETLEMVLKEGRLTEEIGLLSILFQAGAPLYLREIMSSLPREHSMSYGALRRALRRLMRDGLVSRVELWDQLYVPIDRGIKELSEDECLLLQILSEHPEGLSAAEAAMLFGESKYGEPIPFPYCVLTNKLYKNFRSLLSRCLRRGLIRKVKGKGVPRVGDRRKVLRYEQLTARAKEALEMVKERGKITYAEVASAFGIKGAYARQLLSGLVSAGMLKRKGKHYELAEQ